MQRVNVKWVALCAVLLSGCSAPEELLRIAPQKLGDAIVEIQTRPAPVAGGKSEFMVIMTTERGRPVPDYIVSLRADSSHRWQQGIQDGLSGVYRKAVAVPASATHLYVKFRKKLTEDEAVLEFPLQP